MARAFNDSSSLTKNVQSRREQLASWEASETNKASSKASPPKRVKFRFEVAFLAACSSSDFDEITRLLQEEKVDINTSNVDGLTALHQACIDNKLELVRFLCEHGANLHARDNEGWTPLHATGLGGHSEIAKYLMKRGASLAVANSDGDLPHDVAELPEMKALLRSGLAALDESVARAAEADAMRLDAEAWLRDGRYRDLRDPVANAGPIHVAAAKGYQQVLTTLLQCPGAPLEAIDSDGWTALHAAAHWGQLDACRALVAHGASMDALTNANQTVFDLADEAIKPLLRELKDKQKELMQEQVLRRPTPVISTLKVEEGRGPSMRRSSVTRLPQSERHDLTLKGSEQEKHPEKLLARAAGGGIAGRSPLASSESLSSDDELRLAKAASSVSSIRQAPPSPPAFVVTTVADSPPPPSQPTSVVGIGGSRRVEIISAASSASNVPPTTAATTAAPTAAPTPTPTTVPTTAPADVSSGAAAPRSKVRSILTRMESLQETTSTGGNSSSSSGRQQPTGRGVITGGNQRVKSAAGALTTMVSASLDSPLVFPKAEPPRLSQDLSDRLRGGAGKPATASVSATDRNGGRTSASPPPPPPQQQLPPPPAASRRVSVIMEKEKTDESETERRRISRHNRATKRLTQGVTPDDVEQAKKLMEARTAGVTAPSEVVPAPAKDAVDNIAKSAAAQLEAQQQQPAATTGCRRIFEHSDTTTVRASDRLFRARPDSYHGNAATSTAAATATVASVHSVARRESDRAASPTAAADFRQLYERERARTDRLAEENARMRQELDRLMLSQQQQQQPVRVDRRLSEYEAQERATQAEGELNRLRLENSKLKADNTSLIRVISRLSSQPSST